MSAPNVDDPLDEAVADHWKADETGAINKAREWTQNYANNWTNRRLITNPLANQNFNIGARLTRLQVRAHTLSNEYY